MIVQRARRNLDRWRAQRGHEPAALAQWRVILKRPLREIAALLTDPGEEATRLRQSTPFAGALTPAERRRIYEAFQLEHVMPPGANQESEHRRDRGPLPRSP